MPVDHYDSERLSTLLQRHDGLKHVRVKKHGDSLVLLSGNGRDEQKHARLTSLGQQQWGLSLPRHTGRWERTPYVGTIEEIVKVLLNELGFYLARVT